MVKHISDRVGVMYLGNMMEKGDTDELFDNPLHPYTKALFSAVPVPDPDVRNDRIILEGDIPSPANPPRGCKFHTRCPECMGACKIIAPRYREVTPGHFVACHLYDEEILNRREEYEITAAYVEETEKMRAESMKKEKPVEKIKKLLNKRKPVGTNSDFSEDDAVQNEEITHVFDEPENTGNNDEKNEK